MIRLYEFLIFIWAFSSWFPQWRHQSWFRVVRDLVEPYIGLFRGLNLSTGGFDFSAMLAIILLEIVRHAILYLGGGR